MNRFIKTGPDASTSSFWNISKFIFWVLLAIAITLPGLVRSDSDESLEEDFDFDAREERSLLGVKIVNQDCRGTSGPSDSDRSGVCISAQSCKKRGTRVGTCANGYGACCRIVANCTAGVQCPIRFNGTRIFLTGTDSGSYQYVINRPAGVSQVKLDFLPTSVLSPPDANLQEGDCTLERLTVSGSPSTGGQSLTVCGNLTGQHMYLDFGDSDRIMLSLRKRSSDNTQVNIRTTFVRARQRQVPASCLQYFTDTDDTIRSFGFPRQLNNQAYTICIESNSGNDNVELIRCPASEVEGFNSFLITGGPGAPLFPPSPTCAGNTDWIQPFGLNRLCGSELPNDRVTLDVRPFLIRVNFDAREFPANPPQIPVMDSPDPAQPCPVPVNMFCYFCNDVMPCTCGIHPDVDPSCQATIEDELGPDLGLGDSLNTGFCFKLNRA